MDSFTARVKHTLSRIPRGKVATYGQIAAVSGNPLGARQVVWVLHTSSEAERLPWFRVVNSKGRIALPPGNGYELQRALLVKEKVRFNLYGSIDLERCQWRPAPAARKRTARPVKTGASTHRFTMRRTHRK